MAPEKPGAEGWGFSCSCPTLQHRRWSGGSQVGHCGETLHQEHSVSYLLDRNGSNMCQHNHIAKIALLFSAMQQFRHAVQLFLGNLSPDINLQCVDPTLGGHYTPFPQVRASCSCVSAALVSADILPTPASSQCAALLPISPNIPVDVMELCPYACSTHAAQLHTTPYVNAGASHRTLGIVIDFEICGCCC